MLGAAAMRSAGSQTRRGQKGSLFYPLVACRGYAVPLDVLLGVTGSKYSPGVREMCCRESLNCAFAPASGNLHRTAQLTISSFAIRTIVESQGQYALSQQTRGEVRPDFTAEDCVDKTVITGTDGVEEYDGKNAD